MPGGPPSRPPWRAPLGWPVLHRAVAGGRDYDERRVDWARLTDGADRGDRRRRGVRAARPQRRCASSRSLRSRARARGGSCVVLLVGAAAGAPRRAARRRRALWRDGLARLDDPFLAVEPLGEPRDRGDREVPRFAVVGRVNKGKSSIVATLAEDDSVRIDARPGTTTEVREYPVRVDGRTLFVLVDTPGFEDAPRALAWLRAHEVSAAERPARVERVRARARRAPTTSSTSAASSCPSSAGASVLYVVDGTKPFRPNYEAEMEILRWTGRPGMALVNRIGEGDHVAEWHRALGQYFRIVRDFDAFSATFEERLHLLETFRELRPEWRGAIDEAVDRARRAAPAAPGGGGGRGRGAARRRAHPRRGDRGGATRRRSRPSGTASSGASTTRSGGARQKAPRERRGDLPPPERTVFEEAALARPVFQQDLFAEETWHVLGLSPGQIVAASALAGATAGGVARRGGRRRELPRGHGARGRGRRRCRRVRARPAVRPRRARPGPAGLPGARCSTRGASSRRRRFRIGPHAQPNFPWVLLDRALLHYDAVGAPDTHARRGTVALPEGARARHRHRARRRRAARARGALPASSAAPAPDAPRALRDALERALARILARVDPVPGEGRRRPRRDARRDTTIAEGCSARRGGADRAGRSAATRVAKNASSASFATVGARACQSRSFTTTVATTTSGRSAGAKPTNQE